MKLDKKKASDKSLINQQDVSPTLQQRKNQITPSKKVFLSFIEFRLLRIWIPVEDFLLQEIKITALNLLFKQIEESKVE